ncbi:MAG: hypothetical protein JXR25_05165 [Pontiellaceae bacterium]|nr:hypothetical protein [Pontiellaceae bacterium]MBN2784197.1 hypothetical protein [Pontiellaceae bacterium]
MHRFLLLLFWVGVLLLFDASLGLIFEEVWQKRLARLSIRRLALAEGLLAVAFLVLYYYLYTH